jgi:hypothetical protein
MWNTDMPSIEPAYMRPADAPRFGLSRSSIYNLIRDGVIKTVVVRRPGNVRGARLICVESLRQYLASCPEK